MNREQALQWIISWTFRHDVALHVDARDDLLLALQSLSLESARSEALEEAAKVCETEYRKWSGEPTDLGVRYAAAIRALQSPARVAEGESPAKETFAEKIKRLQDARDQIDAELSELL